VLKKIILRFLTLCLITVVLIESTALFLIGKNAFHASVIDERTKQIATQTCHPYTNSTWFIHDGRMYVVCYSDNNLLRFSIEPAKYQQVL